MRIMTQRERDEAMITIGQLVDAVEDFDQRQAVYNAQSWNNYIPPVPQFVPGVKTVIAGSLGPTPSECPGYSTTWHFIDNIQNGKIQWSGADKMYYEYPDD